MSAPGRPLRQVLAMARAAGASVRLSVTRGGSPIGTIHLAGGDVSEARLEADPLVSSDDAISRLLGEEGLEARAERTSSPPPPSERAPAAATPSPIGSPSPTPPSPSKESTSPVTDNPIQELCQQLRRQVPGAMAAGVFSISDGLMIGIDSVVPDTRQDAMSASHVRILDDIFKFMKLLPDAIAGELQAVVLDVESATFLMTIDESRSIVMMLACDKTHGNLGIMRLTSKRYLNRVLSLIGVGD